MTSWLTQDVVATAIALGAAVSVLRRIMAFARPGGKDATCPSCGTASKPCARSGAPATTAESPVIQISRRAS